MNTTPTKAAYLAQYWGQLVLFHPETKTISHVRPAFMNKISVGIHCLYLRDLFQIPDQHALELARIALFNPSIEDWDPTEIGIGDGDYTPNGDHSLEVSMRCWEGTLVINDNTGNIRLLDEENEEVPIYNTSKCVDFIKANGYAWPFMDKPKEQLIEDQWLIINEK